jgi:hypothetical protein
MVATRRLLHGCGFVVGLALLCGCGPASPAHLELSPAALTLAPGASQELQVRLQAQGAGPYVLAPVGLPAGFSTAPASLTLSPGQSGTLVLQAGPAVGAAHFALTFSVRSSDGAEAVAPETAAVAIAGGPAFDVDATPAAALLPPGGTLTLQLGTHVAGDSDAPVVLDLAGLPEGVGAAGLPATTTLGASVAVQLQARPDAPSTTAQLTVTAQSGRHVEHRLVQLTVAAEDPSFVPARMDLPVLRVTTADGAPIVSEDAYLQGHLTVDPNGADPSWAYDGDTQIRGRGNTSWQMPKKPYKVKLASKASLLGMPKDKEWALLANYDDKTLLRNELGLEVGRRLGMPYTPRSQFVELFLNDAYQGTYQLTESIKIASSRVDITELDEDDTDPDALTGGYLMEFDARQSEDWNFLTPRGLAVGVHDPSPIADAQQQYLAGYVGAAEDALFSDGFADPDTGYAAYLDPDTFARWYLANELMKTTDGQFVSSCWFYKDRGGRLEMGPVWDFDSAAGNVSYGPGPDPQGPWIRGGPWYARLFQDPAFAAAAAQAWQAHRADLAGLVDWVGQRAAALDLAQRNNFSRWPILQAQVWPNSEVAGSYAGEVAFLQSWLQQRLDWLDATLATPSATAGQ